MKPSAGSLALALVLLAATTAHGGDEPSAWNVSYPLDATLIGAFAAGSLALSSMEVDRSRRWKRELLPWDESVRFRFSRDAAAKSDTLAMLALTAPMFAVLGSGLDESAVHRGVIYAEALSAGILLNSVAKYVVQRPRPYVYNRDPKLVEMTRGQKRESHLSFYSGHSTFAFTAAVAGSYLYGAQSTNESSRAALWGVELALASATANLRVRAGKHFYTDVVMGALVGAGIGAALPRLHLDSPDVYSPTAAERIAMVTGVAAGTVFAWTVPLKDEMRPEASIGNVTLAPLPLHGGAGIVMAGPF